MQGKQLSETLQDRISQNLNGEYTFFWETDDKGIYYGWFRLTDKADIGRVAKVIAGLAGRVMAITASATDGGSPEQVEIAYHFAVGVINCTFSVALDGGNREISSITPVLKSADWPEREMQELYDIHVLNHPNPRRLFLADSVQIPQNMMVPLSEAMDGSSTSRLWERIMQSRDGEGEA